MSTEEKVQKSIEFIKNILSQIEDKDYPYFKTLHFGIIHGLVASPNTDIINERKAPGEIYSQEDYYYHFN